MHVSSTLIALALGYLVIVMAYKESGSMRLLGRIVGAVVILASVLLLICGASQCSYMKKLCGKGACSMMKSGSCPMMAPTGK